MRKKIIIGSRGSKLALLYAQQAKDKIIVNTDFGNDDILIKSITTKGDEVQDTRLSEVGGKGLFKNFNESDVDIICDKIYRSYLKEDLTYSEVDDADNGTEHSY